MSLRNQDVQIPRHHDMGRWPGPPEISPLMENLPTPGNVYPFRALSLPMCVLNLKTIHPVFLVMALRRAMGYNNTDSGRKNN